MTKQFRTWRKLSPAIPVHNLGSSLAAKSRFQEAIPHFEQAVNASGGREPASLTMLAAMQAETGRFAEAAATARRALEIALQRNNQDLSEKLQARIADYEARVQGK